MYVEFPDIVKPLQLDSRKMRDFKKDEVDFRIWEITFQEIKEDKEEQDNRPAEEWFKDTERERNNGNREEWGQQT